MQNDKNANAVRPEPRAAAAGEAAPGAAPPTGSTDESIGRPSDWREGRYQRSGEPVDQSVKTPPATSRATGPKPAEQRPVTLRDYEK
jgi:hypothetical protein